MNLSDLAKMGITASLGVNGELDLLARRGAITPGVREEIATAKRELLSELRGEHVNLVNLFSPFYLSQKNQRSPIDDVHDVKVGAGRTAGKTAGQMTSQERAEQMLRESPELSRTCCVLYPDADPVLIGVAVRGKASCTLTVPADRFDPFKMLELAEKKNVKTALPLNYVEAEI